MPAPQQSPAAGTPLAAILDRLRSGQVSLPPQLLQFFQQRLGLRDPTQADYEGRDPNGVFGGLDFDGFRNSALLTQLGNSVEQDGGTFGNALLRRLGGAVGVDPGQGGWGGVPRGGGAGAAQGTPAWQNPANMRFGGMTGDQLMDADEATLARLNPRARARFDAYRQRLGNQAPAAGDGTGMNGARPPAGPPPKPNPGGGHTMTATPDPPRQQEPPPPGGGVDAANTGPQVKAGMGSMGMGAKKRRRPPGGGGGLGRHY
jgi:hypothetical protein